MFVGQRSRCFCQFVGGTAIHAGATRPAFSASTVPPSISNHTAPRLLRGAKTGARYARTVSSKNDSTSTLLVGLWWMSSLHGLKQKATDFDAKKTMPRHPLALGSASNLERANEKSGALSASILGNASRNSPRAWPSSSSFVPCPPPSLLPLPA